MKIVTNYLVSVCIKAKKILGEIYIYLYLWDQACQGIYIDFISISRVVVYYCNLYINLKITKFYDFIIYKNNYKLYKLKQKYSVTKIFSFSIQKKVFHVFYIKNNHLTNNSNYIEVNITTIARAICSIISSTFQKKKKKMRIIVIP